MENNKLFERLIKDYMPTQRDVKRFVNDISSCVSEMSYDYFNGLYNISDDEDDHSYSIDDIITLKKDKQLKSMFVNHPSINKVMREVNIAVIDSLFYNFYGDLDEIKDSLKRQQQDSAREKKYKSAAAKAKSFLTKEEQRILEIR